MTEWARHAFTRETICHPAAMRVDVDGTTMYVGRATVGSSESDPHWQIRKVVTESDGGLTITWADGDDFFDNVWTARAGLIYS